MRSVQQWEKGERGRAGTESSRGESGFFEAVVDFFFARKGVHSALMEETHSEPLNVFQSKIVNNHLKCTFSALRGLDALTGHFVRRSVQSLVNANISSANHAAPSRVAAAQCIWKRSQNGGRKEDLSDFDGGEGGSLRQTGCWSEYLTTC